MKRTTLILDPALYAELKRRAATESRTLTEVIERLLRLGMQVSSSGRRGRVHLPSYDLGPYLVNPADRTTFAELGEPSPSDEGAR